MPTRRPSPERIREVTPLLIELQSNLDGELSLESLARRYGFSPFHFHRFFSRAVGETPKQHVERLRLERGAYKLAITADSVLDIALSLGFRNHETFTRAFRRAFACSPRDYRRACKAAQQQWPRRKDVLRGEGCALSDVRFVSLPPMTLLATRRHGAYAELPTPFQEGDTLWTALLGWAGRHGAPCSALAVLICYDDPTITPLPLQRADICIPVADAVRAAGDVRSLHFPGGLYGGVQHAGPLHTIEQAYWVAADGIRRSPRHRFADGPPVQIYRTIHAGGDPSANLTEVYFPVRANR